MVIYYIFYRQPLFCLYEQIASFQEGGKKSAFIYLEGLNSDLKISFSKCSNTKILAFADFQGACM